MNISKLTSHKKKELKLLKEIKKEFFNLSKSKNKKIERKKLADIEKQLKEI